MLEGLARRCYRRRWVVLFAWVVILIAVNFLAQSLGDAYTNDFKLPGLESQQAQQLLKERFPERSGDSAQVVVRADNGIMDPAVQQKLDDFFKQVGGLEHVTVVMSPYQVPQQQISPGGKIAFANVLFDTTASNVPRPVIKELHDLAEAATKDGIQVELGGPVIEFAEPPETGMAEVIGLASAVFILLIAFGSVIAMGLPLLTAIFGLGVGLALVSITAHMASVPNFAPQLASMIGIGVGIDYALLIVTRFREGLHAGLEPEEAVTTSIVTSGRAVLFAGITVVISMLGMFIMGLNFVNGLAIGASLAVLIVMLAALTLLPAILGFAGRSIDKLRVPLFHRDESDIRKSFSFRWSRSVQKHPWLYAGASVALLVVLALPMFKIDLGSADAGNHPESKTTRRAYDLMSAGFGPGFNGQLILAAELPDPSKLEVLNALAARLNQTPGVVAATPPMPNKEMNAAVLTVIPATSPQDHATKNLIEDLRTNVIPDVTAGTGVKVNVGGITAAFADLATHLSKRLPYFIGAVIGLSFLLLMMVFRSLLVPLKAAVMNLFSIGAAYGVVVAVFQWGWGKEIFGIAKTGPIEPFLPMMLFAILFGLSMDYEVFLLSRVREEYLKSGDSGNSVADGLAATARVITAAAAIMIAVFLSFVFGELRTIKLFGLGLAVAIFVDATVVRMILVPSTMELLGDANWWLPKWLDKILPSISVEGPSGEGEASSVGDAKEEEEAAKKQTEKSEEKDQDKKKTDKKAQDKKDQDKKKTDEKSSDKEPPEKKSKPGGKSAKAEDSEKEDLEGGDD
ncbi:MAG: hypothetical protein DCC49_11450 [Acidobacteria bacterium]|nr:MAG: hypothetical protein DCC49_11450 [Acidobacteriota bacterium]